MPWHQAPKKDVTSCDKLRGGANDLRSADFRMGKPSTGNAVLSIHEHIVYGGEPGELKHLSTRRKRKKEIDFLSSGERKGKSPNRGIAIYCGVWTPMWHEVL